MIDVDRTLSVLGVDVSTLTHGSGKKVFRVCEECGRYAVRSYQQALHNFLCQSCAGTGDKNRLYGKHRSPATCKKISNTKTGRVVSDETREKLSKAHIGIHAGEKNPNWKGGITKWRIQLWRSPPYKAWRKAVFERDKFTCQMCGDDSGGNLQAHHIEPVRDHKNDLLIFDVNNGITLCKDCHEPIAGRECEFAGVFNTIITNGGL